MGAGAVVSGSDDDLVAQRRRRRHAAPRPSSTAQGLGAAPADYGPTRAMPPARGELGSPRALPEVRRYDVRGGRGIVHVDGRGPPTIVDGGAAGLAGLAAFGALPASAPDPLCRRPVEARCAATRHAGPRSWSPTPTAAAVSCRSSPAEPGPRCPRRSRSTPDQAIIDPFPDRGTDAQTVAVLKGASYVSAPNAGGLLEFPERDAIKAFDGDLATVWSADRYYHPRSRWIQIGVRQAARRARRRAVPAPRPERPGDRGRHQRRARQGAQRLERDPRQPEARRLPRCASRWSASSNRRTPTCAATAACARCASPACTCASRCGRRC